RLFHLPSCNRCAVYLSPGLGIFVSGASIAKMIAASKYDTNNDSLAQGLTIATLSTIEEQLSLIAACLPYLRATFQCVLVHFGLITGSTQNRTGYQMYGDRLTGHHHNASLHLRATHTTKHAQSEENIL
ncbi:hypothetical protein AOQ84DRAFT_270308, partial [Glonium stellatum]